MTQIEREDLVERYLAGEMTSDQESEFFLHVAVDDELQRTLKAFQIMDKAILSDRDSAVAERSHYREQVFGMLAASHVTSGAGGSAATTGAPAASGGISGAGMAGAGLGAWKSVLISLVAGGLAIGTAAVVLPSIVGGEKPAVQSTQAAPQGAPGERAVPQLAPAQPGTDITTGSSATAPSVSAPAAAGPSSAASSERVRQSAGASSAEAPAGRSQEGKVDARRKTNPAETATQDGAADQDEYIRLPKQSSDQISIPTEVDEPEKKQ